VQPYVETAGRIASETADDLAWSYFSATTSTARSPALQCALQNMIFINTKTSSPLSTAIEQAESSIQASGGAKLWRPMLVVTGRGRRGAAMGHGVELNRLLAEKGRDPNVGAELRKTVGDVAAGLMVGGGKPSAASFLVLEAGNN
jgi:hypothetical protein